MEIGLCGVYVACVKNFLVLIVIRIIIASILKCIYCCAIFAIMFSCVALNINWISLAIRFIHIAFCLKCTS